MRAAHDVAAVRAAERELMARLPEGALMQRAAAGLAAVSAGLLGGAYGRRIVVLAGSGDNGGDALYAAARLSRRGAAVVAVAASARVHPAGAAALLAAGGRMTGPDDPRLPALVGRADLVLDGLVGIGGRGGLRGPAAGLASLLAGARTAEGPGHAVPGPAAPGPAVPSPAVPGPAVPGGARPVVVAVDLPSGIDADSGVVDGVAIEADVTVTFGTLKPGLLVDPGAACAGWVELIDIGLGPCLPAPAVAAVDAADVAELLPAPPRESDKYRRGVVGIAAGSEQFTGAAVLAVGGAVRGGAGMVRLVSGPAAADVVRRFWPEAVITVAAPDGADGGEVAAAGRVQAWVAGPGMGVGEPALRRLAAVLATDLPVLVDADGLTLLSRNRDLLNRSASTLLTPHAGELARLLGADPADVAARRLEHARAAAATLGATVLLKGSTTVIASPTGEAGADAPGPPGTESAAPVLVNPTGTSWLASAGTGDVLSGLAGALLAQGLGAAQAAAAAAYLHGLAAQQAARGLGARAGRAGWAAGPGGPARAGAGGPSAGGFGQRGHAPAAGDRPGEAPIAAMDVVRALPGAFRPVRRARRAGQPGE